jgi:hypothetical protein
MRPTTTWTLTARWLLPVAAPPLANGVLTVDGETIVAVEPAGGTDRDPETDVVYS